MKFIDLSVVVNEETPVYPGDPPIKIQPAGVFAKDGYNDHLVSIGTHVGTHMDAPLHMIDGGKTLDQISIDQFIGRGRLVEGLDMEAVKQAGIEAGNIVLFHTGMIEKYKDEAYFTGYPEISEEVANYLVEKRVKIVGVDMCSPDHPPFKIHKILLGSGVLIIENLTNLDKLIGKEFKVYALPIKFALDGAPARVIAQIK
ncbi:MAG TPA: cyclase family protein [Candidatus Saccharimonadales bacterium]|nr:cyclase family protein [Candidatus Saccharimonadales bacterium]